MAPVIEARSLAIISQIANNPPANPRDVTFRPTQQPLILYIARVPGTRGMHLFRLSCTGSGQLTGLDIFLSTMKPLPKGVTAQDVESCLYYVHLDSLEDEKLLEHSPVVDRYFMEQPTEVVVASHAEHVKRKPLASGPTSGLANNPKSPLHVHAQHGLPLHGANWYDTAPVITAPSSAPVNGPSRENVRSLNGPRPMHPRLHTVDGAPQQPISRLNIAGHQRNPEQWDSAPPELPPRPDRLGANIDYPLVGSLGRTPEAAGNVSPQKVLRFRKGWSVKEDPLPNDERNTSLTLIRRYDGIQSNVGKILCTDNNWEGSLEPALTPKSPLQSSKYTVIEIFTAGYSKFADPAPISSPRAIPSRNSTPLHQLSTDNGGVSVESDNRHDIVFRRHLRTKRTTKRPRLKNMLNSSDSLSIHSGSESSPDARRQSHEIIHGTALDARSPHSPTFTQEPAQSSNKGHSFESPWNGICEFHTGIAGRSLKCTHRPASSRESNQSPISVSELRFNLPSSSALGPPRNQPSANSSRHSKRSSVFSLHSRGHSTSAIPNSSQYGAKFELEERMDLSLSRERAGGGFGGKHAKLGKLIVEDEGLKMLDLVVATNIALVSRIFVHLMLRCKACRGSACLTYTRSAFTQVRPVLANRQR